MSKLLETHSFSLSLVFLLLTLLSPPIIENKVYYLDIAFEKMKVKIMFYGIVSIECLRFNLAMMLVRFLRNYPQQLRVPLWSNLVQMELQHNTKFLQSPYILLRNQNFSYKKIIKLITSGYSHASPFMINKWITGYLCILVYVYYYYEC